MKTKIQKPASRFTLHAAMMLFSLFSFHCSLAQQWTDISNRISSSQGSSHLSGLYFIGDKGWITSSNLSELYITSNGGVLFETINLQGKIFNDISMRTPEEGYSAGADQFVYKTVDGGMTWAPHGSQNEVRRAISYRSTDENAMGVCVGNNSSMSIVLPNSAPHVLIFPSLSADLTSADCPLGNIVWACGGNNIIRFFNAQVHRDQDFPTGFYNAIFMLDNTTGWCVGKEGRIIRATDGINWSVQTNPDPQQRDLLGVYGLNENNVWAVGAGGVILHTADGGQTWNIEGAGITGNKLKEVFFTANDYGYAIGENNTLLWFGTPSGVQEEPVQCKLTVYPNPTRGKFQITSTIPSTRDQTNSKLQIQNIEVVDLYGKVIKEIVCDFEFDITRCPAGIYFIRIYLENQIIVKKIIKL